MNLNQWSANMISEELVPFLDSDYPNETAPETPFGCVLNITESTYDYGNVLTTLASAIEPDGKHDALTDWKGSCLDVVLDFGIVGLTVDDVMHPGKIEVCLWCEPHISETRTESELWATVESAIKSAIQ